MDEYYNVLGISKSCDIEDVKKAYRKLAKIYHPDLYPNNNEMVKINQAYSEIMKNLRENPDIPNTKPLRTRQLVTPPNVHLLPFYVLLGIILIVILILLILGI